MMSAPVARMSTLLPTPRTVRCTGSPGDPREGCGQEVEVMYGDGKPFADADGRTWLYVHQHGNCGWRSAIDAEG